MARDAHPLRVVLVGCGGISKTWLQASAEIADLEVVGLVDLVAESAKARRAEFAITAEIGSDLAAMLERLKPDLVFDCTAPEAHTIRRWSPWRLAAMYWERNRWPITWKKPPRS